MSIATLVVAFDYFSTRQVELKSKAQVSKDIIKIFTTLQEVEKWFDKVKELYSTQQKALQKMNETINKHKLALRELDYRTNPRLRKVNGTPPTKNPQEAQ